jgi:hypothetical protein
LGVVNDSSYTEAANGISLGTHNREKQEPAHIAHVPRSKRRGLLGFIVLVPEVDDASSYPRSTKWLLTWIMALMAWLAPLGGTIFYRTCIIIDAATQHFLGQ